MGFWNRMFGSLYEQVRLGNLDNIKEFLERGADINVALRDGAFHGQKKVVEYLVEQGADLNAKGKDGKTPLDLAIELNQGIVSLYIQKNL